MTARPLPEAVEKALVAFSDSISDMENGHATNGDAVRAEDALRAAIAAAIKAEREACAGEVDRCEAVVHSTGAASGDPRRVVLRNAAAAIRARGGA